MPIADGDERLVYDIPEVARILGMGRNAAYEAAKRGYIPTIRIGKLIRVPKVALTELLESGSKPLRSAGPSAAPLAKA